jgi:hypothetical protein
MKIIDTKTHGYMDYIMGIFLLASPSLFSLNVNAIESTVFYIIGVTAIIYSLLTNYELGFLKIIPMKGHLALDIFSGIFLAASPWLLGFAEIVYMPHLVLGIIEIGAALFTTSKSRIEIKYRQ